jgi:hypothetical protein
MEINNELNRTKLQSDNVAHLKTEEATINLKTENFKRSLGQGDKEGLIFEAYIISEGNEI